MLYSNCHTPIDDISSENKIGTNLTKISEDPVFVSWSNKGEVDLHQEFKGGEIQGSNSHNRNIKKTHKKILELEI